jgi:hypothetical protein
MNTRRKHNENKGGREVCKVWALRGRQEQQRAKEETKANGNA